MLVKTMFDMENVTFLEAIFQKRTLFLIFVFFIAGEIVLYTQREKFDGMFWDYKNLT